MDGNQSWSKRLISVVQTLRNGETLNPFSPGKSNSKYFDILLRSLSSCCKEFSAHGLNQAKYAIIINVSSYVALNNEGTWTNSLVRMNI